MGLQVVALRGRNAGLMPPPPSSRFKSISTPSSYSTMPPAELGQGPPVVPMSGLEAACGAVARLKVTSYQRPAVVGEPPVTREASPGKESEGVEVEALV